MTDRERNRLCDRGLAVAFLAVVATAAVYVALAYVEWGW